MYVDTKTYGTINKFVCEFLQDENGTLRFLKIADFDTDGKPYGFNDWKISKAYKKSYDKISKQMEFKPCEANIVCRKLKPKTINYNPFRGSAKIL